MNARDLGGLPLATGGTTPLGAVVRSDNVHHLTPTGWDALARHGVRTVVDLRFDGERREDPPVGAPVVVHHVSLFGDHDPAEAERIEALVRTAPDAEAATAALYVDVLRTRPDRVATALEAVAGADDGGGVLIHCFVGKDRTGIAAALLLHLAGVSPEAIADDYALSEGRVGPLVDDWIAEADDPVEREVRRRISAAPAGAMARVLAWLDHEHGGAAGYLQACGLSETTLARVRRRLAAA